MVCIFLHEDFTLLRLPSLTYRRDAVAAADDDDEESESIYYANASHVFLSCMCPFKISLCK